MRGAAIAITWQLWWRHRWGLTATGAYLIAVILLLHTGAVEALYARFGGTAPAPVFHLTFVGVSLLPMVLAMSYLLGVFCYGFQADLGAPGSLFPARMFTLPVPTRTLVLWPMLSGAGTLGLGWVAVAQLILRPSGLEAPLGWPALQLTALLTWLQAILWWPFGLPKARLVVLVPALSLLLVGVEAGKAYGTNPVLLGSLLAGCTLTGGWVTWTAVSRARRGEEPDWQRWRQTFRRLSQALPRRRRPFASAAWAQVWFEWRRHGLALPLLVLVVLPLFWWPAWFGKNEILPLSTVLLFVFLLPPFVAGMAGTSVSGSNAEARDYYGLPPFTAVRPMTCGALVAAKVKMAALSTLAAWGVLLLVVSGAVVLTGNLDEVAGWWNAWLHIWPAWRVAGLLGLALVGLMLLTWKQFIQNLFIGLTGKAWVINGSIIAALSLTMVLALLGFWIYHHPQYQEPLLGALPGVMGLAVVLKLLAIAWALRALRQRRILRMQTVVCLLAFWVLSVVGLVALLAWLIPAGTVSIGYVATGVVLFVPLARLLAAPLALAWNRHR